MARVICCSSLPFCAQKCRFGNRAPVTDPQRRFYKAAIPYVMVYAVIWGVAIVSLPLLAGSDARAGLTFAMLNVGVALAAPLWGYFGNRVAIGVLVFLITVLSTAAWLAIILLGGLFLPGLAFLFGLTAAGIFALATVQVTQIFPKDQWDGYIARMQSLMTMGQVAGLAATALYAGAIVGLPFLVVGVVTSGYVWRGSLRHVIATRPDIGRIATASSFPGIVHAHFTFGFRPTHLVHLANIPVLIVIARFAFFMLACAPVYAIYPLLMKGAFAIDDSIASVIYSASTALMVATFLVSGWVAKRFGPAVSTGAGGGAGILAFLAMLIGYGYGIEIAGAAGFAVMVALYAFAAVGMNDGIVGRVSADKEGEVLGIANTMMSVANVLGGLFAGTFVTLLGYSAVFWFGLVLCVIVLGLGVFLHKPAPAPA